MKNKIQFNTLSIAKMKGGVKALTPFLAITLDRGVKSL